MKLKRLFSGLLVSLIAIVSVLLCVKVSNAAGETFKKVTDVNDLAVGDVIAIVSESKNVAMGAQSKKLRTSTTISISNSAFSCTDEVSVITLEEGTKANTFAFKVSDGYLYDKNDGNNIYTGNSKNDLGAWSIKIDNGQCTIRANTSRQIAYNTSSPRFVCYKDSSISTSVLKPQIYKKDVASTNYNVSFNADIASFKSGKGETITPAVGNDTNVTLPTIDDLDFELKDIIVLSGWSDGTNTYNAGQTVTVSDTTQFKAVYTSDVFSVSEAIRVAEYVGATGTKYEYSVRGIVSSIDATKKNIFIVDESDRTKEFELYNTSTSITDSGVKVGDLITGTGKIKKYSSTYELDKTCTFEVTRSKPATAVEFEKVETMSSLSFDWATADGNDYTVLNVSLRFGNLFTKDAYAEGATYGVLLIQNSDLAGSDFATYLAEMTLEEINADSKIENVEATPVKVNAKGVADEKGEYYQFAAVLSDMDEYLTTSITAVMYVVIDGQIYYSVEKTASVQSVAEAYYNDEELKATLDEDVENALLTLAMAK